MRRASHGASPTRGLLAFHLGTGRERRGRVFAASVRALLCVVAVLLCTGGGVAMAQTSSDVPASTGAARPAPIEGVVNVNAATVDELTLLPGVGPARARSIIAYRDQNGPFKQVSDLLAVSGIGERALGRMRAFVVLEGETTARRVRPARAASQQK